MLPLLAGLFLTGCGFTPLYGNRGGHAEAPLDQIYIDNIPDRNGVYLRNLLIDRFYQSGAPDPLSSPYKLHISAIDERISDLDITKTADATRAQLIIYATITLQDTQSGQTLLKRSLQSITSYNILRSQFTTYVSEQAAREAALTDMARQVERHISLYFGKRTSPPASLTGNHYYR